METFRSNLVSVFNRLLHIKKDCLNAEIDLSSLPNVQYSTYRYIILQAPRQYLFSFKIDKRIPTSMFFVNVMLFPESLLPMRRIKFRKERICF